MHPNIALIERFYSCFKVLDGDGMAQCYHEQIEFSDPVFPKLEGSRAGAMWKMLCSQAQGFDLVFNEPQVDDTAGKVHWEATYIFSATRRKVHNRIDASFRFQDGKIIQHHDSFSFWRWSSMALGPLGTLLGWSPVVKSKVRGQAAQNLERFLQKSGA